RSSDAPMLRIAVRRIAAGRALVENDSPIESAAASPTRVARSPPLECGTVRTMPEGIIPAASARKTTPKAGTCAARSEAPNKAPAISHTPHALSGLHILARLLSQPKFFDVMCSPV